MAQLAAARTRARPGPGGGDYRGAGHSLRQQGDEATRRTAPYGDPVVPIGRVVLSAGEHGHPDVRRIAVHPAPPARGIELRDGAGHRRTAAGPDPALPAEGARGAGRLGPPGVGRRRRLRHHLPRPALRAALPGQRRTAARADRPAGRQAAGQVAAAVGDVSGRGPVQEPGRPLHQVASSPRQRHDRAGDQPRHRRPHQAPAVVSRGHLGSRTRPGQRAADVRGRRRLVRRAGRAAAGRRVGHRRAGDRPRRNRRDRPSGPRLRPQRGARHRAQQPAERHRLASPAVHCRVRQPRRLPDGARGTTATSTTWCSPSSPVPWATG